MDALLETIRTAVASDASDDARTAGASACRTLLIALEAKPGDTMSPPSTPLTPVVAPNLASTVAMLRGMPVDQLLDLAIGRLRAALPVTEQAPRVEPLKFHLVQLPSRG